MFFRDGGYVTAPGGAAAKSPGALKDNVTVGEIHPHHSKQCWEKPI